VCPDSSHTTVDVNVFGPIARADDVARQLGRMDLFLQTPSHHDTLIPPYFNPQCLELPAITPSNTTAALPVGISSEKVVQEVQQTLCPDEENVSNIDEPVLDLDDVMKGVRQFGGSGVLHIDSRITTALLPYVDNAHPCLVCTTNVDCYRDQKKGVEFIIQREKVDQLDERSLWDKVECGDGSIIG
jgi:hypothetical protein